MWIKKVDLTNFRSYANGSIELSKGINLIVGQNNSGKSTLLKSFAWLQDGSPISAQDIRKKEQNGSIELELEASKGYFNQVPESVTKIIISLSNQKLTFSGSSGIRLDNSMNGYQSTYDFNAFSNVYPYRIPNQEPFNFIYPYLSKRKVIDFSETINLQATNLVSGNFTHLSAKVDRLCNAEIPEHREFIESCREIIGFPMSAAASTNGKKAAQSIDAHYHIYLEEMGEGVANLLGLIVDLCVAKDKLFLIEEPENDIHPRALKKLLELIAKKSETNQFIITTHSNIVVKYLGAIEDSKLFQVTMDFQDKVPTSKIEEVENIPEPRLAVLSDLGYDLFDFDRWSAWLFLEESSAERIIRDFLIPWFAPDLKNRLRTVAAQGKDDIEIKFEDFNRLFLFVHLQSIYQDLAWVIIDEGVEEKAIIDRLKEKFKGWNPDCFRQFSQHDFEFYYPKEFMTNLHEEIERIQQINDKKTKRNQKKNLLDKFVEWIKEDNDRAKSALEVSASSVINILKEIETSLN
jgi:AAA15 family ATPase/GTPase